MSLDKIQAAQVSRSSRVFPFLTLFVSVFFVLSSTSLGASDYCPVEVSGEQTGIYDGYELVLYGCYGNSCDVGVFTPGQG